MYVNKSLSFEVGYCNQLFYSRRKRVDYSNKRTLCFTANSCMTGTSIIVGDITDKVSVLIMVVLISESRGLCSSPGQGYCVEFLCKTLNSHSTSLHPGI